MGIRFYCEACQRKLNVKAFLAGKRGVCPHCGASLMIPNESQIASKKEQAAQGQAASAKSAAPAQAAVATAPAPSATAAPMATAVASAAGPSAAPMAKPVSAPSQPPPPADAVDEAPQATWYVRPPSGGQFGPAKGDVMRRWIGEGRVSGDSLVWREGWADWKSAEGVFPELAGSVAQSAQTAPAASTPAAPGGGLSLPVNTNGRKTVGRPRKRNNSVAVFAIVLLALLSVGLLVALFIILGGMG